MLCSPQPFDAAIANLTASTEAADKDISLMTTAEVNMLRTYLIGAWTLQSAQLMRAGRTPFDRPDRHLAHDNELAAAASGYMSYGGPYTVVDEGLIAHHVEVSLLPNWIGGIQRRKGRPHGERLELSPPGPLLIGSDLRTAKLVWRRA